MPNSMPASAYMTTADFICFLIFLILQASLLYVPPEKFRKPFVVVSISSSITCIAMLIWALSAAKGAGPLVSVSARSLPTVGNLTARAGGSSGDVISLLPPRVKGADLGWAMVRGVSSVLGSWCAGVSTHCSRKRQVLTSGDSEYVGLQSIRAITKCSDCLPIGCSARLWHRHLCHWHPVHIRCSRTLPRRGATMAAIRPPDRNSKVRRAGCSRCRVFRL
jgi:hypothetical protein